MSCNKQPHETYVNINYNDRTYGDTYDYSVTLNNSINNVTEVQLLDISVEISDTIVRDRGFKFTIQSYNNKGNSIGATTVFEIFPKINNIVDAIDQFNKNNAGCTIGYPKDVSKINDYTYATFNLNIVEGASVTIFIDHNHFLEQYFNIPYDQIAICNEQGMKYINQTEKTRIVFITTGITSALITSTEAFLLTNNTRSLMPNAETCSTEPLGTKSVVVFLNSINGDSFNSTITNNNATTNSFFIIDTNSQKISSVPTNAITVIGISTPVRNVPLISKKFSVPIKISGLRVKLIYSDNTRYAVNEVSGRGKSTLMLKFISSQ